MTYSLPMQHPVRLLFSVWALGGDTFVCKGCGNGLDVSLAAEALTHQLHCPTLAALEAGTLPAALRHPWRALARVLAGIDRADGWAWDCEDAVRMEFVRVLASAAETMERGLHGRRPCPGCMVRVRRAPHAPGCTVMALRADFRRLLPEGMRPVLAWGERWDKVPALPPLPLDPRSITCPECLGWGEVPGGDGEAAVCAPCKGEGRITTERLRKLVEREADSHVLEMECKAYRAQGDALGLPHPWDAEGPRSHVGEMAGETLAGDGALSTQVAALAAAVETCTHVPQEDGPCECAKALTLALRGSVHTRARVALLADVVGGAYSHHAEQAQLWGDEDMSGYDRAAAEYHRERLRVMALAMAEGGLLAHAAAAAGAEREYGAAAVAVRAAELRLMLPGERAEPAAWAALNHAARRKALACDALWRVYGLHGPDAVDRSQTIIYGDPMEIPTEPEAHGHAG